MHDAPGIDGMTGDGAEPGANILVYANAQGTLGAEIGKGVADGDGRFSVLVEGGPPVFVAQADGAGNVSEGTLDAPIARMVQSQDCD